MADFEIAYKRTGGWEGFYSNDPQDSGGETIYGVSRKHNPKWAGWAIVDEYKVKAGFPSNMRQDARLPELAKQLYRSNYWNPLRASELTFQSLANKLYDIAVNKGVSVAIRFMADLSLTNSTVVTDEMIKHLNDEKRIINTRR